MAPGIDAAVAAKSDGEAVPRARSLGKTYTALVEGGEKSGLRKFLLEEPVEDLVACFIDLEEWLTAEDQERLDKKAEKLISGKEFAKMLRERPELKTLVARLTKRALSRMKKKMMRR